MPTCVLEARRQAALEETITISQRIRRSSLAYGRNRPSIRGIAEDICRRTERICASCDAVLQAFVLEATATDSDFSLDYRVTDWLSSGQLQSCLGKLREIDGILAPDSQVTGNAIARPLTSVENRLATAITIFNSHANLFRFLSIPDILNRKNLLCQPAPFGGLIAEDAQNSRTSSITKMGLAVVEISASEMEVRELRDPVGVAPFAPPAVVARSDFETKSAAPNSPSRPSIPKSLRTPQATSSPVPVPTKQPVDTPKPTVATHLSPPPLTVPSEDKRTPATPMPVAEKLRFDQYPVSRLSPLVSEMRRAFVKSLTSRSSIGKKATEAELNSNLTRFKKDLLQSNPGCFDGWSKTHEDFMALVGVWARFRRFVGEDNLTPEERSRWRAGLLEKYPKIISEITPFLGEYF